MSDTFALVTGSSGGLGAEIASCLARLHARNVIVSGRSEQRLRPVVERLANIIQLVLLGGMVNTVQISPCPALAMIIFSLCNRLRHPRS